ncbi:unnamed protein product [Chironomus riparius]|uniref:Uncharacterized protein n=1 Tax=Chironomus riparius TaxID=315576 RepID=A0A9N9WLK1_9DIPT|nr:unnamed protein product [Chironomus riparius]
MRGFSSRIPMPGTSATTQSTKMTAPSNDTNQIKTKLARPTDIGGPLSSFVRPTAVTQKITQITKSSLSNLTSRIMTRQFSMSSSHIQKIESSQSNNKEVNGDDDQMLIDETIDLVGSDDNMLRYASKESIQSHQPTFDLCRRDGTFIKSPTRGLNATPSIGSVNSLPDAKDKPSNTQRAVSKSRDSLNSIISNQTRIARLRKSGNDLLGSSLSLTKSPIWGSEDILNVSPMDNENVSFVNSQLRCGPFFNHHLPTDASARILCHNDEIAQTAMDVDECDAQGAGVVMRMNEARVDAQKRFSFGLDITECTLDCSIELCDTSMSSTMQKASPTDKQGSFDVDESLGILTPDQMKEFLDSTNTNHTNNLELPLIPGHKLSHHYRVDQTPSPEELPLDPVGVKMEEVMQQPVQNHQVSSTTTSMHQEVSQAESDPKTEMTKSVTSKVSTSIITSITSITSLDTGYIGDGEMSRPASRGAMDQSPSKVPRNPPAPALNWNQAPPAAAPIHRQRQDPMTDSDFFTESDADDIFHQRENQRRAQVIDGHLYGPMLQGANVIFQQQPQQNESDSCMESSGVFTDVENRGDDDLLNRIAENRENLHQQQQQHQFANDMSPDLSSDTITSNGTAYSQKKLNVTTTPSPTQHIDRPRDFINETSSSLCSAMDERAVSVETINLINDTSSFGSTKSCCMTNDDCDKQMIISDGSSAKKVTASASKKLSGTNRKTFKNEANFGLKKHEMSSRGAGIKMNNNDKTVTKKCMNGKWEPVMNKIAENKNSKKKFDNVKSKVTSGAVKRATSNIKTPPSDDHSIVSTESTGAIAKRNSCAGYKNNGSNNSSLKESPTGSKRGRAHSKDSHQSSQSDLSMNGAAASPKIIKSSSTRAAKKRDVRTISSSPSDLGPPPKTSNGTNQTQKSSSRTLPNSQKRAQPQQIIQPPAVNQIAELKGSPPAKKIVPRRLINASPLPQDKTPLKDHSRLSQQQSPVNGSRSSIRSNHSSKAATPPPNNNSNRNGIIESINVSPKSKAKELENNNSSKIVNKNNANVNKMQQEQLLQQIIDQQALEKQKHMLDLLHANKNVEALGVLVQYLVFNLDAFSCPSIKKSQQKTQMQLLKAHDYIDEIKSSYQSLEEKMHEREDFFSKRELELQELHRCEMAKAKKSLEDLENEKLSKEKLIIEMKRSNEEKIRKLSKDVEQKLNLRDQELNNIKDRENDLMKRIQRLTVTENELRDKVHSSELEYGEKLQHATMKERDLSDKINQLTKVLDDIKIQSDVEKRELEEKLNLSQDELSVLRNTRNSCFNESFQNRTINTSLQDEVESLRCVLELKQHEISELRKINCELQRAADDAISAQIKCSALESRVEDLQVQLHAKNEEEKELLQKLKTLQEQNDLIQKKSSRLSLHNEELQWRLKQNAERYSMTLNELSKSYHESSSFMCNRSSELDISGRGNSSTLEDEDVTNSPPASPIIKGVVEKSDSVSWVLEMDDETPEVLANRMVRRAGSFRSDKCSPSPVPKKQKCQNNSSIQQSASATSIIRQHSEPSPLKTLNGRLRSKSVSASKAIEPRVKAIPQMVRSISGNGAVIKNLSETAWKHHNLAMKTSSPNPKKVTIGESIGDELIIDEDFESTASKNGFFLDDSVPVVVNDECESFHRDTAPNFKKSRENRGLITCDTAALSTDIIKKHRRPKVSAGEIKFSGSGSNSEEEEDEDHSNTSSASSTVSTGPSTPSISSSSSTSSSGNEQPIESIEDALLRWKEHNNTPMEVSWCEEEPRESCV